MFSNVSSGVGLVLEFAYSDESTLRIYQRSPYNHLDHRFLRPLLYSLTQQDNNLLLGCKLKLLV